MIAEYTLTVNEFYTMILLNKLYLASVIVTLLLYETGPLLLIRAMSYELARLFI